MPVVQDRRPLVAFLKVQDAAEVEVIRQLGAAAGRIGSILTSLERRSGVGSAVRAEQLRQSRFAIRQEITRLYVQTGLSVAEAQKKAAAAAAETIFPKEMLGKVFSPQDLDYMVRSARMQAEQGIQSLLARNQFSYDLSSNVYRTEAYAQGLVDDAVNAALARGASAAELARDVRSLVNPNTPGGVRYASQRLARTEINNAFHTQQVKEGIEQPWVVALKWNLSGSHPRPDECNDYADNQHFDGGDAGVWKPNEVPGKPHPNCLCYTTPVTPDEDEFIKQYQAGKYDQHLVEKYPDLELRVPVRGPTPSYRAFDYDSLPSVSSLPESQADAASRYAGYNYRSVNARLRGTTDNYHPDADKWVSEIDEAMKRSVIPDDGTVYRGQGHTELFKELNVRLSTEGVKEFEDYARGDLGRAKQLIDKVTDNPQGHGVMKDWDLDSMVGKSFTSRSYFSTSVRDSKFDAGSFSEQKIQFKVNVPRGTRGFTYGDTHGERELVLDRDLTYTVVGVAVDRAKNQAIVELLVNPKGV